MLTHSQPLLREAVPWASSVHRTLGLLLATTFWTLPNGCQLLDWPLIHGGRWMWKSLLNRDAEDWIHWVHMGSNEVSNTINDDFMRPSRTFSRFNTFGQVGELSNVHKGLKDHNWPFASESPIGLVKNLDSRYPLRATGSDSWQWIPRPYTSAR